MAVYAIIKIAGKGTRLNSSIPKQFIEVHGKPIFIYTLERFEFSKSIDFICVVTDEKSLEMVKSTCTKFGISKAIYFTNGGDTGNDSIFNGFRSFSDYFKSSDIVVCHDGVRPLATVKMIDDVIAAIKSGASMATPGIKPNGMMLFENNHSKAIKREDLIELQTPTAVCGKLFCEMMEFFETLTIDSKNNVSGIDTIGFLLGHEMYVTEGSFLNFKITYENDLRIFEAIIDKIV